MSRTQIVPVAAPGNYAVVGAAATWTAVDVANGNYYKSTGKELVVCRNQDGAVAHTLTITSVPDPSGRTGDVVQSIPASSNFYVFGPFPTTGWQQTNGQQWLSGDDANLQVIIITLP